MAVDTVLREWSEDMCYVVGGCGDGGEEEEEEEGGCGAGGSSHDFVILSGL